MRPDLLVTHPVGILHPREMARRADWLMRQHNATIVRFVTGPGNWLDVRVDTFMDLDDIESRIRAKMERDS